MKMLEKEEELDELKEKGQKIILDCFAEWCGPCILIGPHFEKWSKEYPNVIFAKIDVDESEELAESLDVENIPTFIFMDEDGEVVDTFAGGDKNKLEKLVKEFCEED